MFMKINLIQWNKDIFAYGKLSVLRLPLWCNILSIVKNVSCTHEKNMYSAVVGCSVLYMLGLVDLQCSSWLEMLNISV